MGIPSWRKSNLYRCTTHEKTEKYKSEMLDLLNEQSSELIAQKVFLLDKKQALIELKDEDLEGVIKVIGNMILAIDEKYDSVQETIENFEKSSRK